MNRRHFVKLVSASLAAMPFVSIGATEQTRSPESLFSISKLRDVCRENGFVYVEDKDVWYEDCKYSDHKFRYTTFRETNFWLYRRWPFFHRNDKAKWDECLKWNAIEWKSKYPVFLLYDIVETTLPFQKEQGEFYSMIICAKRNYT